MTDHVPSPASQHDLSVEILSDALKGIDIDFVVSGSIAAVESVRLIRSLRRLGANVFPFLTSGGAQFITPMALEWASAQPVVEQFSGRTSHIGTHAACVIAPASANFVSKIVRGITDCPATALVASYLGQKKPVLVLPAMHASLEKSPAIAENLADLERLGSWVKFLQSRREEGKVKFPDPETLADIVSHEILLRPHRVLIAMGTTHGPIDAVRYVSNYSSGALGTAISHELFRMGFQTTVVCGPSMIRPKVGTDIIDVKTTAEMAHALSASSDKISAFVMAASVLDYEPEQKEAGKIRSDRPSFSLSLKPTPKLIRLVNPSSGIKVGFKLEVDLSSNLSQLARKMSSDYGLSMLVYNQLSEVGPSKHRAQVVVQDQYGDFLTTTVEGKAALAKSIVSHIAHRLSKGSRE